MRLQLAQQRTCRWKLDCSALVYIVPIYVNVRALHAYTYTRKERVLHQVRPAHEQVAVERLQATVHIINASAQSVSMARQAYMNLLHT